MTEPERARTVDRLAAIRAMLDGISPDWDQNGYEVRATFDGPGVVILDGWHPKHAPGGWFTDSVHTGMQWRNVALAAAAPQLIHELLDALDDATLEADILWKALDSLQSSKLPTFLCQSRDEAIAYYREHVLYARRQRAAVPDVQEGDE